MTPDQIRARSADKVKQILELMKVLNLNVEARERVTQEGFIEKIVYWVDSEKYPQAEPVVTPEVNTTTDAEKPSNV